MGACHDIPFDTHSETFNVDVAMTVGRHLTDTRRTPSHRQTETLQYMYTDTYQTDATPTTSKL